MEKGMNLVVVTLSIFIVLSTIIQINFVSAGFFEDLLEGLGLAPVNASNNTVYAPFDASVTILGVNTPPSIIDIQLAPNILICETQSLSHFFNVSDIQANIVDLDVTPSNPFFVRFLTPLDLNDVKEDAELFSAFLNSKSLIGIHSLDITATDSGFLSDLETVSVEVIEINRAPNFQFIGAQTVYTQGDDSTFFKKVLANDIEDGNQDAGILVLDLSFINPGDEGMINLSAENILAYNGSVADIGVHDLHLCVVDLGIPSPHPQIVAECGQDGGPITTCMDFSITVTNENRGPRFENNYPINLSFNTTASAYLYFNVTKYDPDGTVPDAYWYVDDVLIEIDSNNITDEFEFQFSCSSSGIHFVEVEITDGLLNNSLQWNITTFSDCPPVGGGGGGGGGGGSSRKDCVEKWGCDDYGVCQEISASIELGSITADDFISFTTGCNNNSIGEEDCGYHLRNCIDVNNCRSIEFQPMLSESCFYIPNPSCTDGIKNCHDDSCEVLVDCGGPCNACPTCSDGTKNQNEEGKDCGGFCPNDCKLEIPDPREYPFFSILLILIVSGMIVVIILMVRKIMKERKNSISNEINNEMSGLRFR